MVLWPPYSNLHSLYYQHVNQKHLRCTQGSYSEELISVSFVVCHHSTGIPFDSNWSKSFKHFLFSVSNTASHVSLPNEAPPRKLWQKAEAWPPTWLVPSPEDATAALPPPTVLAWCLSLLFWSEIVLVLRLDTRLWATEWAAAIWPMDGPVTAPQQCVYHTACTVHMQIRALLCCTHF